jgi:hypothetical protein
MRVAEREYQQGFAGDLGGERFEIIGHRPPHAASWSKNSEGTGRLSVSLRASAANLLTPIFNFKIEWFSPMVIVKLFAIHLFAHSLSQQPVLDEIQRQKRRSASVESLKYDLGILARIDIQLPSI